VPNGIVFSDHGIPFVDQGSVMSPDVSERPHGHVEDAGMPKMSIANEEVAMVDAGQVGLTHSSTPHR
jgi:hypothetical protein